MLFIEFDKIKLDISIEIGDKERINNELSETR